MNLAKDYAAQKREHESSRRRKAGPKKLVGCLGGRTRLWNAELLVLQIQQSITTRRQNNYFSTGFIRFIDIIIMAGGADTGASSPAPRKKGFATVDTLTWVVFPCSDRNFSGANVPCSIGCSAMVQKVSFTNGRFSHSHTCTEQDDFYLIKYWLRFRMGDTEKQKS